MIVADVVAVVTFVGLSFLWFVIVGNVVVIFLLLSSSLLPFPSFPR